jgi:sulfur-carrier protein
VVQGATVREALEHVFEAIPDLRAYLLDDQGGLRKHVVIFVDGRQLADRTKLSDPLGPSAELHVMQALSGG